jgi:hypothetical protein
MENNKVFFWNSGHSLTLEEYVKEISESGFNVLSIVPTEYRAMESFLHKCSVAMIITKG